MKTKDFIQLQALREDLDRVTSSIDSILAEMNRPQHTFRIKKNKKLLNKFIEEQKDLKLKISKISPNN